MQQKDKRSMASSVLEKWRLNAAHIPLKKQQGVNC